MSQQWLNQYIWIKPHDKINEVMRKISLYLNYSKVLKSHTFLHPMFQFHPPIYYP